MIDIHSHIIFDVDDGPKNLEESKKVINELFKQGVRTIIASPHNKKGSFEKSKEEIKKNYNLVREEALKIDPNFKIYLGSEMYYTLDLVDKIKNNDYLSMNDSKYILLEFKPYISFNEMLRNIQTIMNFGIIPILAHIERYKCLEYNEIRVRYILKMGCLTQVNADSVLPQKIFFDKEKDYKKRAKYFLKKDLVFFIASDTHNLTKRKPHMFEAYEFIKKKYGIKRANDLFLYNQKNILLKESK